MKIAVRPVLFPADYPALARFLTAENPTAPTTPEELARQDATRDPKYFWSMLVAEDVELSSTPLVGMASFSHDVWAHREGKFKVSIRVRSDLQGCGIGSALYQGVLATLKPLLLPTTELHAQVAEAHPRASRFAEDRGFVEGWRRIFSRLDVSRFEATPELERAEQLEIPGVEIVRWADLAHDPERLAKLCELDNTLWQSVPYGEPLTPRSVSQFEHEEVNTPKFLPEAYFISVHQGEFVGYSGLTWSGSHFTAEMTGTLTAYRGKGLATLLKMRTIRYAQAHGGHEIVTVNDAANASMIQLNRKLGFEPQSVVIRYIKRMDS
jgi:mycothiol synthase